MSCAKRSSGVSLAVVLIASLLGCGGSGSDPIRTAVIDSGAPDAISNDVQVVRDATAEDVGVVRPGDATSASDACTSDELCPASLVCDRQRGRCVKCTGDIHCSEDAPICNTISGECSPCVEDEQCEKRAPASNACVACSADHECASRKTGGTNPGVCLNHLDGRCATDEETIYAESIVGCVSSQGGSGGSAKAPFCFPQLAVDAARMRGKPLVVLRGALSPGFEAAPKLDAALTVVGQAAAVVTASASGAGTGIRLAWGEMYLRDVVVSGAVGTGVGVVADPGATLRLERVKIVSNPQGGLALYGAGFALYDVLLRNNGPGDDGTGAIFSGVRIRNVPANAPKSLRRVSVLGAGSAAVSGSQPIEAEGLFVSGTGVPLITPTCAISACPALGGACGSSLQP
jgi:hypothetical protein